MGAAKGEADVGAAGGAAQVALVDVARRSGVSFRHGAFRYGVSADPVAMMGSGLCWLDYDRDGWLDLFLVNSYAERDIGRFEQQQGLPRSALYRNVRGRFVDVSRRSGAALALRGTGCAAADLDGDGTTDLYVAAAGAGALLWNNGDGTFTEGARAAGVDAAGWHSSVAVGDVNLDGHMDLFVAGYTDLNAPIAGSTAGFPTNHRGVRDLLYLNLGRASEGRPRFREVGREAGIDAARFDHGLGAVFTDLDLDGRPDLYVANDEDPNRLYQNVAWPGGARADPAGLGFRFEERGGPARVADPNAGMGIAAQDFDGDGIPDLFVSNSRGQAHALFRGLDPTEDGALLEDATAETTAAFPRSSTGWGTSWADLDHDSYPDLVLANGAIPVTSLTRDRERLDILSNRGVLAPPGRFAAARPGSVPRVIGRGLATADYDNDGDVDIAVSAVAAPPLLLRNGGAGGNWLTVDLGTPQPGARVTALLPDGRRLVREAQAGSSYLSSESPRLHFGLGRASRVDEVAVRFPDGHTVRLRDLPVNRLVVVAPRPYRIPGCDDADRKERSVARIWDEAILAAIRKDTPAPTTHARNLFHLSAAMWDAWAAYDITADGYFVDAKQRSTTPLVDREAAISYAAYRILAWRYSKATGSRSTLAALAATMRALCYRPGFTSTRGDSPAALGNRIAAAVIAYGQADGALEHARYADETYVPVNEPLVVRDAGTTMHDPTRWQPLALDRIVAQNGLSLPGQVQTFIGAHWGRVKGFALPPTRNGVAIDPGEPALGLPDNAAYQRAAVDVIRRSSELDAADGTTVDVGAGAIGNNPLGTNDGHGHQVNPVTGRPYPAVVVRRADYARALAEFWADGPKSETPPGHWNVIANIVSDAPELAGRIGGDGSAPERLRWDVQMYFALNGALHDAAIVAWGAKRRYDTARPISMIRYLAGNGQSSDPAGPSYDRAGLPLVPGLIEVVTPASSAPGERHASLRDHVGEIAVRSWLGPPADPATTAGVGWILGTRWLPYQRATFVTPAFAGYVSGHSTFSRAAAEVLTSLTGTPFFPGGRLDVVVPAGSLGFERGPTTDVTLQAATYYDAADSAGVSRLYGGIHVGVDDLAGRRLGARVGVNAWMLAIRYFAGSARP